MSQLTRRIDRLDASMAPKGKTHLVAFVSPEDATDEGVAAWFAEREIVPGKRDKIVTLIHRVKPIGAN